MSSADSQVRDSQAAWTALGDRMRKTRSRLLLALVVLGTYLAARSWLDWRRQSQEAELLSVVVQPISSTPADATDAPHEKLPDTLPSSKSPDAHATAKDAEPVKQPSPATASKQEPANRRVSKSGRPDKTAAIDRGEESHEPRDKQPTLTKRDSASAASTVAPGVIESWGFSLGKWVTESRSDSDGFNRIAVREVVSALGRYTRGASRRPSGPTPPVSTGLVSKPGASPVEAAGPVSKETPGGRASPGPAKSVLGLSLVNPATTGGAVHYLLNGQERTLRPGQSQQLPAGRWRIEFHRGGNYGDAAYTLASGSYRFQVTGQGWDLLSVE